MFASIDLIDIGQDKELSNGKKIKDFDTDSFSTEPVFTRTCTKMPSRLTAAMMLDVLVAFRNKQTDDKGVSTTVGNKDGLQEVYPHNVLDNRR